VRGDSDPFSVGDEALVLVRRSGCPVVADPNRVRAARALVEHYGCDLVLSDDGLQHLALGRDVEIIVVDGERRFGNGRCLPAGPLREPVAAGMTRADLLVSIGDAAAQARFGRAWGRAVATVQRLTGVLRPLPTGLALAGRPVLAFAGIGYPDKFFATLRALGADLRAAHALADHRPLTRALMARLARQAERLGAQMVTTEKDAARLPPGFRQRVATVPVRLELADWTPFDTALEGVFSKRRQGPGGRPPGGRQRAAASRSSRMAANSE